MDYVETEKNGGQQLEAYTGFAAVYDIFMDNVPYEEWGEYIHSLLKDRGIEDGILLDLGCGTGLELEEIFRRFPDLSVTGIDMTASMLEKLRQKALSPRLKLICGDYFSVNFGREAFDAAVSFQSASKKSSTGTCRRSGPL